ncbi:pilus assembly protein [Marinobacter caseinilyticus]|uniref:pilus assembly protein n=1 Tax=Marinobacter caseinilyticus TaxID=2692195 RepID=UPI0014077905|nr:PilC/PilY family type IV pilus protein [Marinobacter caseinilyticus]
MNTRYRHTLNVLAGLVFTLPAAGYSALVEPADEPLFLSGTVKHNVMLAIDDSGSMDFETLFSANDGALWLDENGSFVKSDGTLNDAGETGVLSQSNGGKYTYIIPNGRNGTYDGRKILSGHYAVPPIKPFAFARSGAFNKSYYDPNVQYDPWPSYGGLTFNDIEPTSAPFDARRSSQTNLDLTANINTAGKADWGFTVSDADMPCTDAGGRCGSTGTKDYTYFPAHYYVVRTSGEYTYTPTLGGSVYDATKSVLLEAEDATVMGAFQKASSPTSTISNLTLIDSASVNDYAGVDATVVSSLDTPPLASVSQLDFSFEPKQAGDHVIWLRRRMPDGNSDSFWLNMVGKVQGDFTEITPGNETWVTSAGEDWNQWWQGHTASESWVWEPWAKLNFSSAFSSESLRIRHREANVYLDQVLITPELAEPVGAVSTTSTPRASVTRNCTTDPDPSHYGQFVADTSQFSGVDAIGPGGECLTRVDIKPITSSYSYTDDTGASQSRTYAEEITNFANWFTYYRRRHQSIRGGLASAFQGLGGIQVGLFWINNRRDVSMYDMDSSTDVTAFLTEQYNYVSSGGTPNREALNHAALQLKRTDTDAPIAQECQKNFTLLFTDGFSDNSTVGGINNADGSAGSPYQDAYSSSLGDIAYKYYLENLRPDLTVGKVRVPSGCNLATPDASLDCNANIHMNTYTAGLGAQGQVFGVTHNNVADAYSNPPTWPDTGTRDRRMIDDLYHASVNGRGEMFNASTPADLRRELASALRDIIASIGNASSVSFNTGTLNSDSLVFSASFNSTAWSGDLSARALDANTGDVATTASWSAATQLDNQAPGNRVIVTYSNDSADGVPFRWDPLVLDTGQIADLARSNLPLGLPDLTLAERRLNYLRGTRTGEGQAFRNRANVLGDIVHSTPLFVGDPKLDWPDAGNFGVAGDRYSRFKNITARGRTPVIYVGSNDGMLHGFNGKALTTDGGGQEILGYVPRSVFSTDSGAGLSYLTQPDYGHRYYVDLTPQAVDIYTKASPTGSAAWRTALIGGLRNGGVGFFALDVTDPSTFSEANADDLVLWEFNENHDRRLNYALSEPSVGLMPNGRWALILGNGLSNGTDPLDEKTGVFIVYMDGGLSGSWTEGADYEFIELADTGGLSAVQPIDTDGDSIIDRVYGGDQSGNMWVVDVSSSNSGQWESAFKDGNSAGALPVPLYTATDSVGNPQPISTRPLVIRNVNAPAGSEGSNGENYMVYFGTGRYFTQGDASDTSLQTFYGVWDRGDPALVRTNLVDQTLSEVVTATKRLRKSSSSLIDWDNSSGNGREYGWRMDLPESGERVINPAQLRGEIVFFETFTPSQSACEGGGSSWLMSVDQDGSNPEKPIFDTNGDGLIDSNDGLYVGEKSNNQGTGGTAFLDDYQYLNTPEKPEKREVEVGESGQRTGRLGWQELLEP